MSKAPDAYLEPYREAQKRHGHGFDVTLWGSPKTQQTRFGVFTEMVYLPGKRILDAGCSRGDFAAFLLERELAYESFTGVDGLPEVIDYANKRGLPRAEFHDVYHVLFEYGTNIRDEAMIQFVPLGNGRRSLPYVACTIVSAVFYPEFWGSFYEAFMRGRQANTFHNWDFEPLLTLPTAEVREMIFGSVNRKM